MKILGHPLHMVLIHFPAALFPLELVSYYIYYRTGNRSFADASFYAVVSGALIGWAAVVTGVVDLMMIKDEQAAARVNALIHGSVNTTVVVGYSVIAYALYPHYPALPAATVTMLLIKASLNLLMIAGNYLGGTLILKYRIAIHNS